MRLQGISVVRWAHGGDGVAIPEQGPLAGMVVFVKGAVPGDRVTVEIVERKKRWARGVVVERIEESAERVNVPCAVHAQCGGCPWMAGSSEAQRQSRLAILRGEVHKRLRWPDARITERVRLAPDIAPSFGYRCRLRLGYVVQDNGDVQLGTRAPKSHRLVDLSECVVAESPLSAFLQPLREAIRAKGAGQGEVSLLSGEEGVGAWISPAKGEAWGLGPSQLTLGIGEHRVVASPRGFAQANRFVTAAMLEAITEAVGRPVSTAHALELFAGSGTLTRALFDAGFHVSAYELSTESEDLFAQNTVGEGRARFHACDLLDTGIPIPAPEAAEVVLLDPPRQGALPLPWLREFGARRIVLVSCDVSTALRDLAELQGRYEVLELVGWNMFPHTGHQELIATLERRG